MTIDDNKKYPRIGESWLLRNDRKYLLAYKRVLDRYVYRVLSPEEASVISLFNGSVSLASVKDVFFRIFDLSPLTHPNRELFFKNMMAGLSAYDDLLAYVGAPSPSVLRGEDELVPDFSRYQQQVNRLERPLSVIIGFTNRCVCDCVYCFAERGESLERPLSDWMRVFDELTALGVSLVDIGGGDIFTRPDALEILEEMISRDFTFFVSTKSYINRDQAERLYRLGIGRGDVPGWAARPLQVSIDSANAEAAAFMVKFPGYLETITETVENLLAAGLAPRVKCILTAFNADAPEMLIQHFAPLGIRDFCFSYYQRSLYVHDENLFVAEDQKKRLNQQMAELATSFPKIKIEYSPSIYAGGVRNVGWELWRNRCACSGGRVKMVVKPDGDVVLCEQTPHTPDFVVGNVFEQGILGVWNSPKMLAYVYPNRGKFEGTVCYDCPEFASCHETKGYCRRDTYSSYGTIFDAPPECPNQTKVPLRNI